MPAVSEVADSHEMLWHDVLLYGRVGKSEKVMPGGRKSTLRTHFLESIVLKVKDGQDCEKGFILIRTADTGNAAPRVTASTGSSS